MYIEKTVYIQIFNSVAKIPYETGGILGELEGVVRYAELDMGIRQQGMNRCCYSPNTEKMNTCISTWSKDNIIFCGIFHSHLGNNEMLSEGDLHYIKKIMLSMPKRIQKLYFPLIVLPQNKMKLFTAIKHGQEIEIMEDSYRVV